MAHYALHVWVTTDTPTNGFKQVYGCADLLHEAEKIGGDRAVADFVEEAIYHGTGPDTFLERVDEYLDGADQWHWDALDDLAPTLALLSNLIHGSALFLPHLKNHRTLQLLFNIAKQRALGRSPQASPGFYDSVFALFRHVC